MERLGVHVTRLDSLKGIKSGRWDVVVIGRLDERPLGYKSVLNYLSSGGTVLFQDQGDLILELFPEDIYGFVEGSRDVVTPSAYHASVFTDLSPTDMSWFQRSENFPGSSMVGHAPYAASGFYNVRPSNSVTLLAETTVVHGYRQGPDSYHSDKTFDEIHGYPLFTVQNGRAIVSSMLFEAEDDPIANKLLINSLEFLANDRPHEETILIPGLQDRSSANNKLMFTTTATFWVVSSALMTTLFHDISGVACFLFEWLLI
jgi:hypothetical protein